MIETLRKAEAAYLNFEGSQEDFLSDNDEAALATFKKTCKKAILATQNSLAPTATDWLQLFKDLLFAIASLDVTLIVKTGKFMFFDNSPNNDLLDSPLRELSENKFFADPSSSQSKKQ